MSLVSNSGQDWLPSISEQSMIETFASYLGQEYYHSNITHIMHHITTLSFIYQINHSNTIIEWQRYLNNRYKFIRNIQNI